MANSSWKIGKLQKESPQIHGINCLWTASFGHRMYLIQRRLVFTACISSRGICLLSTFCFCTFWHPTPKPNLMVRASVASLKPTSLLRVPHFLFNKVHRVRLASFYPIRKPVLHNSAVPSATKPSKFLAKCLKILPWNPKRGGSRGTIYVKLLRLLHSFLRVVLYRPGCRWYQHALALAG